MRRLLLTASIVLLLAMTGTSALSQVSELPSKDTFFPGNNNGNDLRVRASSLPTVCTDGDVVYMEWGLSTIDSTATVDSAELSLTTTEVISGIGGDVTFELREVADDSWNETDTSAPGYGNVIETRTVSLSNGTAGQTVVFDSSSLAAYIENQRGGSDDKASMALRISAGCGLTTIVTFEDRESAASGPNLQLQPSPSECRAEDVNCDGAVDIDDLDNVAALWRSQLGDLDYDPDSDVNKDEVINVVDATMVAAAMGQ